MFKYDSNFVPKFEDLTSSIVSTFFLIFALRFSNPNAFFISFFLKGIFYLNCFDLFFQPFFVERVFHIFDKDDNGSISLQEFIDAMHQFAGQSPDDKIKFLFKVYDIDGKFFIFTGIKI